MVFYSLYSTNPRKSSEQCFHLIETLTHWKPPFLTLFLLFLPSLSVFKSQCIRTACELRRAWLVYRERGVSCSSSQYNLISLQLLLQSREHQGNDSYVSLYSPEVTCFTIINQHTTHPSARLFGSNGSAGTCLSSLIFLLDFTHMGCLGFIIFSGFSEGGQCCFPIISLIDDGSSFFLHIIVLVYHDTGVLFNFF